MYERKFKIKINNKKKGSFFLVDYDGCIWLEFSSYEKAKSTLDGMSRGGKSWVTTTVV
jgi:ribonucleotide monophosphatase NagD (HAD superfamily)